MAEQASERAVMNAPPDKCYEVVADFERYPEWAADIKAVTIEARDDDGRPSEVAFRAAAFGRSTNYTLRFDYGNAPKELSWVQTRGDLTSRLDVTYVFEPTDHGDTEVTYHLTAELRVPIPGFIKMRATSRIMATAMRELKARVESIS